MVKRNFRKTDITAIEQGLVEKQNEERILGHVIAERKDEDLFFVDSKGDIKVSCVKSKKLKIDEILTPKSHIKPLNTRFKSKKESKVIEKLAKRKRQQPIIEKKENTLNYDIWEKEVKIPKIKSTRKAAVELAHPGMSYRPAPIDHNDIIIKAAAVEFKKIEENRKMQESLSFPEELLQVPSMEEIANRELFAEEEEQVEEELSDETKSFVIKQFKKKTRAERNKESRSHKLQQELKKTKTEEKINKQVDQIGYFKKELKKPIQEKIKAEKIRRFGKIKELPIPVQLSDELATSLRSVKPEGNLLQERFVSYQKRSIIEGREPTKIKPRYRKKEFEKKSFKYF